jgi:hypothetical protein
MLKFIMRKFILFSFIILSAVYLPAQNADDIINTSRNRIKSDSAQSQSKMTLTAKNGSTSERVIKQFSKDGPDGSRTVVEFLSPASVKGTRFLTMQNKNNEDDRWIYMPEPKKVRRIAARAGGGSFVGTDMSYDDISSTDRDVDKDTHKILREETLNGSSCYVIESTPKDKSYQYSKMV